MMKYYYDLIPDKDKIAIIEKDGSEISYHQLAEIIKEFNYHFNAEKKSLYFILCNNDLPSVAAYLSCLQTNNAAVLLSGDIDKESLIELTSRYEPDYIWEKQKPNKEYLFCYRNYGLLKANTRITKEIHPALSVLLSTSGSTGSSKLTRLTQNNLQANASSIAEYLSLNDLERPVTVLPMNYSFGLSIINSHLLAGAVVLLTDETIISKNFWEFAKKYSCTSISGVPYTYEILRKLRYPQLSIPTLKYMTQAGGKLSSYLVHEIAEKSLSAGIKFYVMYGQTEATARISYLPPDKALEKNKSIGIPIPGGSIEIINTDSNIITIPNIEGELVYKGPNVMLGYAAAREDLCLGDEMNGVLHTGDIGYFDEEGYYYITGRMKRFLKIYGNRVSLDDIESYLQKHEIECACGGYDDNLKIVCIKQSDIVKIRDLINLKYHFHHSAVNIFVVPEIIKNEYGKIKYAELFSEKK